ncbi:MAG: rod shape-determining protein MreD [Chlorobi bacterium]|nr:rod shape-determining protein MreD [Chlorobiota bacterium]
MNNIVVKNIVRFLLLVLVQVFILNKLNLFGYLSPFVYVLFILLLPFRTNKLLLLVLAFLIGLTIDVFGDTPGLHASATVLMAFIRPSVISVFFGRIEFTQKEAPDIKKLGFIGFGKYAFVLVMVHHFSLYFMEALSFSRFFDTLKTTFLSTLLSMVLIYIIVFLFSRKK